MDYLASDGGFHWLQMDNYVGCLYAVDNFWKMWKMWIKMQKNGSFSAVSFDTL